MRSFLAHVKEWQIVTHRTKRSKGRRNLPLVKWVKVVLYVPTSSWRLAHSIGARLSRVMAHTGHSVSVGPGELIEVEAERDFAYEALHRWQEWSLKLHRKLGLVDGRTLPDDTKGRAKLQRIILANVEGCRMGIFCREHGHVHGAEAEQLRSGVEKLIGEHHCTVGLRDLERLLEEVDARDSLAYLEIQGKRDKDDE